MLVLHTGHGGPQMLVSDDDLREHLGLGDNDILKILESVSHTRMPSGQTIFTADRLYAYFNAVPAGTTAAAEEHAAP